MASSGCASSMTRSSVVPERASPTTNGNAGSASGGVGGTGRYHSHPSPTDRSSAVPQEHPDAHPTAPAPAEDLPPAGPEPIVAVTVTYRRPELLLRLLDAVGAQTR